MKNEKLLMNMLTLVIISLGFILVLAAGSGLFMIWLEWFQQ